MSIATVRPNAIRGWGGTWYNNDSYGPSPDIWRIADASDGSYMHGVEGNTWVELHLQDYALAANERAWRARAVVRVASHNGSSGFNISAWLKPIVAGDGGGMDLTGPYGGPTTVIGPWYDGEWDQNALNNFCMAIRENYSGVTVAKFYEAYVEYEILHQPVTGAVGPNGTQNTRTPTVTWAYSDPDARLGQRSWRVHIRRTDTNELVHDSGEVFNGAQSYQLPALGAGGYYYVIVQVSNANFGAWYSNWTYSSNIINIVAPPAVPTGLARTGVFNDTSPNFQATLGGYIGHQAQTKARFEVWNADAAFAPTTLVGSVDSEYRTGAGDVTAEYVSTLPLGRYVVRTKAIESNGQESGWSSYVSFQVTTAVNQDRSLLWNVATPTVVVTDDLTLRYNVIENKAKQLGLLWNTYAAVVKDLTLSWNLDTAWGRVTDNTSIWTKVVE